MTGKKKLIIIGALATVVLAGSIGGVALAAQSGTANSAGAAVAQVGANVTQPKTLLSRVATIMGIDQTKLEAAVKQAQNDAQTDATKQRLQNMVAQGTITQAQADAYLKWLQSKPDEAPFQQQLKDWEKARPTIPPDVKSWQQAQPKLPVPAPGGPGGQRRQMPRMQGRPNMQGMMGGAGGMMGGAGGLNIPRAPAQ